MTSKSRSLKRLTPSAATLVVLAASTLAAGCGGGGNKPLSTPAYRTQVNRLVVQVKSDLRTYEATHSPVKLRAAVRGLESATGRAASKLAGVEPPKQDRRVHQRLIMTFRDMQRSFARALTGGKLDKGAASAGAHDEGDLDQELALVLSL